MQHEVTKNRDPICSMKLPMVGTSGESRKFFLPVLCMPEAHNSGGSKILFLWLLIKKGKWVLDITDPDTKS